MAFGQKSPAVAKDSSPNSQSSSVSEVERITPPSCPESKQKITLLSICLALTASMGGLIFGFISGQISGFFAMADFAARFGQEQPDGQFTFSATRQGTMVSLVCIGALVGSLIAGKLADAIGRRLAISASAFFCCIGTAIEISSQTSWVQFAMGRFVNGLAIGSLSVAVPMYQSESAPAIIRGVIVATYQLAITLGIWLAEMVNFGTESIPSSASWRIPNGISFLWALILGTLILFLPESPRFAYRRGREDEARVSIAKLAGLEQDSREVNMMIHDIQIDLDSERAAGQANWYEIFMPSNRLLYRTILGVILQGCQQLTGANFFFYYGTTIFAATGLSNSYVTQIILGTVNLVCTIGGLYVVQKCGRRNALMAGAAWMAMCFLVYSFVGRFALDSANPMATPAAGNVLIVVSCLFIAAFASTWGPLVWGVVAELYPSRYRAPCMALATSSNWLFNFLMSFFTPLITQAIGYLYGLVFAGCCIAMCLIVFFFLNEHKDRTLEEIDIMYVQHVNPITSAKWNGGPAVVDSEEEAKQSS